MSVQPRARPVRRFAFLARPGWLTAIGTAFAFTAACWLILAPWQFSRHHDRDAQNAAIAAALNAAPAPVDDYLSISAEPAAGSIWHQVTASGTFVAQSQVYVRLRQDNSGNPAAEVVVPLRLDDGTLLMVDRGYVPDEDVRAGRPAAQLPTGRVTVTGRVQRDQPDPSHRAPTGLLGLTTVYGIDSAALGDGSAPTRQGFIQLVAGSPGTLAEIGVPQTDDGPFLSYALQWCAFGAMSLLAIGYFVYREATDPIGAQDPADGEFDVGALDGPAAPTDPERADEPASGPPTVGSGGRRSRSRGGFDKSDLYD